MSQLNFDELNINEENSTTNISFFSLNPGQEAIVRFMLDKTDDFKMFQVHPIQLNNKYRVVNCLRNPSDNIDNCPLCLNNYNIKREFYIPMLQYINDNGNIEVKPVIWTGRSLSMAKQLKSYLDNYGPLSDIICKISRTGSGLDTTWNITPNLPLTVYDPKIYAKKDNLFDNYNVLGRIILDKSFDELNSFLQTGTFPATEDNSKDHLDMPKEAVVQHNNINSSEELPINNKISTSPQLMPWEKSTATVEKPTRIF